jgi:predicted nucleic acid-binding protein
MRIIVDTNRIISALLKMGWTREIITSTNFEFYTIDYVLDELRKHEKYILKKAGMNEKEFELLFSLVMDNIRVIPDKKIRIHMQKATDIMKNFDLKDAPILACALAVPNEGIWTEDKDFEKQKTVKIWKTKELKEYI